MESPARKRPNLSMTEAHWLQAMEDFIGGMTDGEVARKWGVSNATVSAQRAKRGVLRRDLSGPSVAEMQSAAAERLAELRQAQHEAETLVPSDLIGGPRESAEGDFGPDRALPDGPSGQSPDQVRGGGSEAQVPDPVAACDALLAESHRLHRAGKTARAIEVGRLARSHLLALRARAEVLGRRFDPALGDEEDETEALPPRPLLRPAQTPPAGDWRTWLFLGGRGAGKTLAGASWLAAQARGVERLALVGPTLGDVREVMIEGASGLRGLASAFGPEGGRPAYEPSRRRLVWPNGARAYVFSAEDPDALRGPQFHAAWADELCAWPKPDGTLAMLRMGLRLGEDPRLVLTTTPRPTADLARLLAEPGLVATRGSALENAEHLAPGFVEGLRALYGGTRLERQEIDGEVLEALEGAVFRRAEIDRAKRLGSGAEPPARFDRLVVAVDPPAGMTGAACGIVVVGCCSSFAPSSPDLVRGSSGGRFAWVLEDRTVHGFTPLGWASRVQDAATEAGRRGPVSIVAEANQGGEMVRQVLTQAGVACPVRLVHATAGKAARAEPVALLYEQGRVAHAPGLEPLEDQLLLLGAARESGAKGPAKSPDRADALVWALTALMLDPETGPRIRVL